MRYVKPICGFCYEGNTGISHATHRAVRVGELIDICEGCKALFEENGSWDIFPLDLNEDGILEQR